MTHPADIFSESGIIEAEALHKLLAANADVKMVDATYVSAAAPVSGAEMHKAKRIGNAVYFDIDRIADSASDMPHMAPHEADFSREISALGISNEDFVVVYDQSGIAMAASRVWWMFRLFGHKRVCVLNGGLPAWEASGFDTVNRPAAPPSPATYRATLNPDLIKDMEAVAKASVTGKVIIDARNAERFSGKAREISQNMRSGHIPGSVNIPFMSLIDPADGRLESPETLRTLLGPFMEIEEITTTCGSGVTACVLALGFYNIGKKDIAVYDGSWTEWGRTDKGTEIAIL